MAQGNNRTEEVAKDHELFFSAMSTAERMAHVAGKYGCGDGGKVTESFFNYLLELADTDKDGSVSVQEFQGATIGPDDMGVWPLSSRCVSSHGEEDANQGSVAAVTGQISRHSSDVGLPVDADGAAFLQKRAEM